MKKSFYLFFFLYSLLCFSQETVLYNVIQEISTLDEIHKEILEEKVKKEVVENNQNTEKNVIKKEILEEEINKNKIEDIEKSEKEEREEEVKEKIENKNIKSSDSQTEISNEELQEEQKREKKEEIQENIEKEVKEQDIEIFESETEVNSEDKQEELIEEQEEIKSFSVPSRDEVLEKAQLIKKISEDEANLKIHNQEISRRDLKLEEINDRNNRVTALGSAMGAVDLGSTPAKKVRIGAGVGNSASSQAVAVGVGYAPTENLRFNTKFSSSTENISNNGISIGASYDLDL